jgi:transcriptional repressor NrdR
MKCPDCNYQDTKVIESRSVDEGDSLRRRRECLSCGIRFTTYERPEMSSLMVIKKDGRREKFNRDKLVSGILKALEKRPVSHDKIDATLLNIEKDIRKLNESEIDTTVIGEIVMRKLAELDQVAYIRFASVYRAFADLTSFEKELKKLVNQQN